MLKKLVCRTEPISVVGSSDELCAFVVVVVVPKEMCFNDLTKQFVAVKIRLAIFVSAQIIMKEENFF